MKNLIKYTLIALLSFNSSNLFSQPIQKVTEFTPQVVFNYENQLKIVWPIQFGFWDDNPKFKRLGETKGYIKTVLGMISKIASQLQGQDPFIINLYIGEKFNEIKIDKEKIITSFTFRDSLLEFNGKHLLQINDGKKWPIQIYFNTVEELVLMEKIDFSNFEEFVEKDLTKTRSQRVKSSKEVIYISKNGDLSRYGLIGRDKLRTFGVGLTIGSMIAYNRVGFGSNVQITLLKYTKGNDNEKHLNGKLALTSKFYTFNGIPKEFNAMYGSIGIDWSVNSALGNSLPFELIGVGFGIYSLEGFNGYNLNKNGKDPAIQPLNNADNVQNGLYMSYIAELRKLYISIDLNSGGLQKYNDLYSNSFNSLTLGYKF